LSEGEGWDLIIVVCENLVRAHSSVTM